MLLNPAPGLLSKYEVLINFDNEFESLSAVMHCKHWRHQDGASLAAVCGEACKRNHAGWSRCLSCMSRTEQPLEKVGLHDDSAASVSALENKNLFIEVFFSSYSSFKLITEHVLRNCQGSDCNSNNVEYPGIWK